MGYKSRGNWLVSWCPVKAQGCIGSCKLCLNRSQYRLGSIRKRRQPSGCWNCLLAVSEGNVDGLCLLGHNTDFEGKCDEWQNDVSGKGVGFDE